MKVFAHIAAGLAIASMSVSAAAESWVQTARQLIAAEQTYPRSAVLRGVQGTTRIRITVAADGTISGVKLLQESGYSILDREAMRMPMKVGKLAPPPGGKPEAIELPVIFRLKRN